MASGDNSSDESESMRPLIAALVTLVFSVPLYFILPGMKGSLSGIGTKLPEHLEILIALSDTFVNYYYVLLPLIFGCFLLITSLVVPPTGKRCQ